MLRVGSLFGHGFDGDQLTRLEDLGFGLRPQILTYAGSQVCRFIDFDAGPALEFIEVTDRSDYEGFVPVGMRPYCATRSSGSPHSTHPNLPTARLLATPTGCVAWSLSSSM